MINDINVAFVGLSHVGLVCSTLWIQLGGKAPAAFDTNNKIISILSSGTMPHSEPGLHEIYSKVKDKIYYTNDFSKLRNYKVIFICQDTELSGNNRLKKLDELLDATLSNINPGTILILMSQVPVGYNRNLENRIKNKEKLDNITLVHWIDTIIMTQAIQCFTNPSRIIIGKSTIKEPLPKQLIEILQIFNCPLIEMTYESAELTKAFINLYLANSVSFANTLSNYCESLGGNINEIIPALQSDKRIGQYAYLRPGLRISGGHLERDLIMLEKLAKKHKIDSGIVHSIIKINRKRYLWSLNKIESILEKKIKGSTITIWGLSYKKDTESTHNAPSIHIIKKLRNSNIQAYDPMAIVSSNYKNVKQYKDKYESLKGSDCLIILTAWDEFNNANLNKIRKSMRKPNIIDCIGIFNNIDNIKGIKLSVMGVGKDINIF